MDREMVDERTTTALAPYVPRLVVDWLHDRPESRHRRVPGTCVFADISGFTALTEKLAVRDKAGAEEMGEILNRTFEQLLTAAYDYGANLVKWGGDAVLLLFDGERHTERAARAAWAMQSTMRRIGRIRTSRGMVTLQMSIGVHTGLFDFLLVGSGFRELIATGPGITTTARMEQVAQAGEVIVSSATAAGLDRAAVGEPRADGVLLIRPPDVGLAPNRSRKASDVDLRQAFPPMLRDHLVSGAADSEHRHVTVAFVEFGGTDALVQQEGAVLSRAVAHVVDAAQEAAEAHGVTILSTDICVDGGKIILVSGAPRTEGDDETRILGAVRRIVQPGGALRLRAGVARGRVFAGDYGPHYRRVYSITGDIVNLAARLMGRAGDGEVIAMPEVVARSRTQFVTTPLEPFHVKGKEQPIEALLVGAVRTAADPTAPHRLPLIGRDAELAELIEADRKAGAGAGQVVDLVGDPGMGKSRLLQELAARTDSWVLWADGDIYGTSTPYQPMQRMLRHTLGLPDSATGDTLADVLAALTDQLAPDLKPWLPLIGIVAGADVGTTPEVEQLDPEVRKHRLEQATSDMLGRVLRQPVIMVFNDVHFMDEATLDLVRRLIGDVWERPWTIVVTRRPSFPAVAPETPATSIVLAPLPPEAATDLLVAATDSAPMPAHRLNQLAERAGGNPLFLRELSSGVLAGADPDQLPDSVEGVIASRLDRLPAPTRRLLRAAAVLGMTMDRSMLEALLDDPVPDDAVIRSELGEFLVAGADGTLQFAHHLIRLTAYEGLPYRRRTTLHARAADVLEQRADGPSEQHAALLSLHCLLGERYAAAWQYARVAGNRARQQYASVEAAECYRRALDAAAHLRELLPSEVVEVHTTLADVYLDLGEMESAEQALRPARRLARTDPHRLAGLHLRTARQRHHIGQHRQALRWVSSGRKLLLTGTDDVTTWHALAELAECGAIVRYDQGAYRAAITWGETALAEARRAGDPSLEARLLATLVAWSALAGQPRDESEVRTALELSERAGDLRGVARTANRLGVAAYYAGRWSEAVDYYAMAEDASRRIGRDFDAAAVAANRAEVLLQQGRFEDAESALNPAIKILTAARATSFLAFSLELEGRVLLSHGFHEEALAILTRARALCEEMGESDGELNIGAHIARCHLRADRMDAALELVDASLARAMRSRDDATALSLLQRVRGEILYGLGQIGDGVSEFRHALASARAKDNNFEVEASLRLLLRYGAAIDAEEAAAWRAEQTSLAGQLGIVAS
jgi:class 3 adenylate cyclase/tetratricopeptide (TPR) repeat protein